ERVGFAIGISTAVETADRLISLGPLPPPGYLGVGGEDMGPALALALGLPSQYAFIVQAIGEGSPAEIGGIEVNDVITAIQVVDEAGTETVTQITSGAALTQFLRDHPAGTVATVFVWRTISQSELGPDWEPLEFE